MKRLLFPLFLCACGNASNGGGTIQFTTSGEVLALGGYAFPPATADDGAFVDGWEIKFDKLLVTVDKLTLSESPDTAPTDQSQTGKKVAELDGPWAVDLHKGGPLMGKGGADEQALPIATLSNQNLNGNQPFDATMRYAFGFDVVAASDGAQRLNIDAADPDYAAMIAAHYAVLYIGTATFRGTNCTSTDPTFDFGKLPEVVHFRLGFTSPTSYVNCQNPDNDPAAPLGDEEHQRGLQIKPNTTTIAQVTIHTDHPFWESFVHDSPAHFDQLAALAQTDSSGHAAVAVENAVGVDYAAFRFGALPLPWRSCLSTYQPPNTSPQMGFDSLSIPYNPDPTAPSSKVMHDYADYLRYDQSTQGHLNSDGLCFVERHYDSPN